MAIVIIAIFVLYWILVLWLWVGWEKIPFTGKEQEVMPNISIIVAMRNEEYSIPNLLRDFANLDYNRENLEIILVNDHSTDRSLDIANEYLNEVPFRVQIIDMEDETGKKRAVEKGIFACKGDIVLTTDADCRVQSGWVRAMGSVFADQDVMLVSGPVRIDGEKSFFGRLQSIEFASLVGAGAATLAWGFATMANAANMAFRKQAVLHKPQHGTRKSSGDDIFRLHYVASEYPGGLHFCKQKEATVSTIPASGLAAFFKQRRRWAGKWSSYHSLPTILLAVFIFLINLVTIALPVMVVWGYLTWLTALNMFLASMLLEYWYLRTVQKFLGGRVLLHEFIILAFIYPFYVVFTGLLSNVKGNTWKGRPLK